VGDLLAAGVSARALRYTLIAVHYRASLNYTDDSLTAAAAAIERLDSALAALSAYREERIDDPELPEVLASAREAFGAALDDDLNVSAGLAAVFDLVRELNRRIEARSLSTADAARAIATLRDVDQVLGILPENEVPLSEEASNRLDARAEARANRDWAASDRLREELLTLGIVVEDTRDGQRWRRASEVDHG